LLECPSSCLFDSPFILYSSSITGPPSFFFIVFTPCILNAVFLLAPNAGVYGFFPCSFFLVSSGRHPNRFGVGFFRIDSRRFALNFFSIDLRRPCPFSLVFTMVLSSSPFLRPFFRAFSLLYGDDFRSGRLSCVFF